MSETIKRPKRKNPILKTRSPTLPPDRRSRIALGLVRGAALGQLELQCCAACGTVQYPPREACVRCLSAELEWTLMSGRGELVSETTLRHSQELFMLAAAYVGRDPASYTEAMRSANVDSWEEACQYEIGRASVGKECVP